MENIDGLIERIKVSMGEEDEDNLRNGDEDNLRNDVNVYRRDVTKK